MSLLLQGIELVERGWVPDSITRTAIRRLCAQTLREAVARSSAAFNASLREGPLAHMPELANEQHYELPPEFFALILGPQRKYSCCYFQDAHASLAAAEEAALLATSQNAELVDGQSILELGCGWGSLSLWMAQRFPNSRITAISNSHAQRQFIEAEINRREIVNLQIITADINGFSPGSQMFDRVVSVEMFEHLRNYKRLLELIAGWLNPSGKLFVHIFCHKSFNYPFETDGDANWMGRHFFSGGMMPSANLLRQFDSSLVVEKQLAWNGVHYQRTSAAWLANMDAHRNEILHILRTACGAKNAARQFQRWRMFFLAVCELFGYNRGEEWFVSHYLLKHAQA